jgi:hypothetical protein
VSLSLCRVPLRPPRPRVPKELSYLVAELRATHIRLAAWVERLVKLTLIVLVTVLLLLSGQARAQEAAGETTGSISPPTSSIQKESGIQAEPKEQSDTGMILVSKRPIEMLARPFSSAVVMYGFPPGRRFRLIGHESGFAQIQDLKSGATGWIDEAALGQSPGEPAASVPSQTKPALRTEKGVTISLPSTPRLVSHTHKTKPALRSEKGVTASLPSRPKPVSHTHKTTTASHKPKPKATSATSTPEHPKRRGNFNRAQGVLF